MDIAVPRVRGIHEFGKVRRVSCGPAGFDVIDGAWTE